MTQYHFNNFKCIWIESLIKIPLQKQTSLNLKGLKCQIQHMLRHSYILYIIFQMNRNKNMFNMFYIS